DGRRPSNAVGAGSGGRRFDSRRARARGEIRGVRGSEDRTGRTVRRWGRGKLNVEPRFLVNLSRVPVFVYPLRRPAIPPHGSTTTIRPRDIALHWTHIFHLTM